MEVLQRTANRGSISTGGYEVANSLKNEPDNGERFDTGDKFTNYSSVRKFTVSGWFKRTELSVQSLIWFNVNTATSINLQFEAGDYLSIILQDNVGNGVESYAKTSALFRDTAAWYHVVLAVDTTDGTAADRTKIYVNGVNQTLVQGNGSYDTFPAQNYDCPLQTRHYLLGYDGGNNGFRGYAAEYYFLDGITASPTDFGEFDEDSGIWKPIEYTGGFGNEGYYLDFEDASALGKDVSSNNQGNFSHYGGSAADQATDTPTNNFCTLNPIFTNSGSANYQTINEGATKFVNAGNAYRLAVASMGFTSGKWYWEVKATSVSALMYMGITYPSVWDTDYTLGGTIFLDDNNDPVRYNASGRSAFGSAFGNGDIIAFALDMDASTPTMTVYKNNSSLGNLMSGLSIGGTGTAYLPPKEDGYFPKVGGYGAGTFECNFGGYTSGTPSSGASDANGYGTFEYAPPTGNCC
mgnify:CR=1 FL=1